MNSNRKLIIAISCIDSRSSGYIMRSALENASEKDNFDYMIFSNEDSRKKNNVFVSNKLQSKFSKLLDRIIMRIFKYKDGFKNPFLGRKVVQMFKKIEKDYDSVIFHIHALHHVPFSMVPVLKHLKRNDFPLIYTFHDVWPFTGGCYNFEQFNCYGYKNNCKKCSFGYKESAKRYKQKIKLLLSIKNLTIVPVSNYCRNAILETPLKNKNIVVINPETNVKLLPAVADMKKSLGISEKDKVIISVCAYWCSLKGKEYLYQIADKLPANYKLLIIGSGFDKKGYENIIHVPFVDNIKELPLYFNISDVFVSVTQGDNFPLVLVEAQCCGVPIVGFGHGGTPEEVTSKSGVMVGTDNNVANIVSEIINVCENDVFKKEDIIASGKRFSSGYGNDKYLELYRSVIKRG